MIGLACKLKFHLRALRATTIGRRHLNDLIVKLILLLSCLGVQIFLLSSVRWIDEPYILRQQLFGRSFSASPIPVYLGTLGLENTGNRCFANSTIQALYNCVDFRREIMSDCHSDSDDPIYSLFRQIFSSLSNADSCFSVCSAEPLYLKLRKVATFTNLFFANLPEDAAEFRTNFLNYLDQVIYNPQPSKPQPQQSRQPCPFDLFVFYTETRLTCDTEGCGANSESKVSGVSIQLTISEDKQNSDLILADLLADYFASEKVEAHCTCGNNNVQKTKRTSICLFPKYLFLDIVRFRVEEAGDGQDLASFKICQNLKADAVIDMGVYFDGSTKVSRLYELAAVVDHHGPSKNNGHYVCKVCADKERYLMCNDAYISEITKEQFEDTDNAYLLIYKKKDPPQKC